MCDHPVVEFTGKQETLNARKPLYLYRCLMCGSTIVLKNGRKQKVIVNKETFR